MGAVERLGSAPHWQAAEPPRIEPGRLGPLTWLAAQMGGRVFGVDEVRLLTTIGRNRRLLRGYLRFATALVPRGGLARADAELVTLRTAWNVGCWYEFFHHIHIARLGGLSVDSVERVALGPSAPGWTPRQAALLSATDELHQHQMISDATFTALRSFLPEELIVELCFLVGHYEMLGMHLKTAGVQPEPHAWERGPLAWLRSDDDSDGIAPSWLPALNKKFVNPVQRLWAPFLLPYAQIVHRGRRSGRIYRTPVTAFRRGNTLFVPLPYGDRTDWVQNLLAAERGGVERLGRLHRVSSPRITDAASSNAPRLLRLMKILTLDIEEER